MPHSRAALLALIVAAPTLAVPALPAQEADTTRKVSTDPLFTGRDALYAAGFAVATVALMPVDKRIAVRLQDSSTQANRFLRNSATGFRFMGNQGALIVGGALYGVGRLGHFQRVADLGLHGLEAIILGGSITLAVKGTVGRARPYAVADSNPRDVQFLRGFRKGSPYSSFPSGHTTTGFAAASAATAEMSRWWPRATWIIAPVMYGGATLIGLSRLYNNDHWASDVILAAGIGTFSGVKVVRYNHTHPGNRLDRWLLGTTVTRTSDGGYGFGWSMAW